MIPTQIHNEREWSNLRGRRFTCEGTNKTAENAVGFLTCSIMTWQTTHAIKHCKNPMQSHQCLFAYAHNIKTNPLYSQCNAHSYTDSTTVEALQMVLSAIPIYATIKRHRSKTMI